MKITLTSPQTKMLGPLTDKAVGYQEAVAGLEREIAALEALRDAALADLKTSLTELGRFPPTVITSVAKEVKDGAWNGALLLNE